MLACHLLPGTWFGPFRHDPGTNWAPPASTSAAAPAAAAAAAAAAVIGAPAAGKDPSGRDRPVGGREKGEEEEKVS